VLYAEGAPKEAAMLNKAAWALVGLLVAAAAYELALAVRHANSPDGEWLVALIALVAMLAGAVLVFRVGLPAALLAPAAAVFMTARFYTGDPYYAPSFQAYGDGGVFSPVWVFLLLGLALLAGITTVVWRRIAAFESAAVLFLVAFTSIWMVGGH
jgi:hypothetical protein